MGLATGVAEAVKQVAKSVPKGAKEVADSKLFNRFFKYSEKAYSPITGIPGTHYTLKKRYGFGIPLVIGGIQLSRGANEAKKDARLSDMQQDELSNMVNISRSPGIGDYEKMRSLENRTEGEIKETQKDTQWDLRTGSASGDLVFALHNLKNGGA